VATATPPPAGGPALKRALASLAVVVVIGAGVVIGVIAAGATQGGGPASPRPAPSTPIASSTAGLTPLPPTPAPPTPSPLPTPEPTPVLVPSALTGLLVTPEAAIRHPIAVMIDDSVDARPQAGFNAAAIVWQAPAEGGIPRYMLIFQDQVPGDVGPVRSSRQYFIEWAAEWHAMYVHHGGSPQALDTLARYGNGRYVWNADGFRWLGRYLWRIHDNGRFAPHNVFTDGRHLRQLAAKLGAKDGELQPAWTFGPSPLPWQRPEGTRITVAYAYEAIQYRYDRATNTYRRFIQKPSGGAFKAQVDAADGVQVAPRNVVILKMAFGPLNDGHPKKHRLEAQDVGHGVAWISSNGVTVKGTWRKKSITAPTLLFGPDGKPVTLAAGQTFVQVMQLTDSVSIRAGVVPPPPPIRPLDQLPV
jgi:hypothetical protein